MLKAGREFPFQAPKEDRSAFQRKNDYFLNSWDKVHFFFEVKALGRDKELVVPVQHSLNKVGHGLHIAHPVFKKFTYSDRIRELCRQLGYKRPAVAQSMYM